MNKLKRLFNHGLLNEYVFEMVKLYQKTEDKEILVELVELYKDHYMWNDLKALSQLYPSLHKR